mmetsp:Transcript_20401/g.48568  ORF Transcript_20401/g.48568 Transcript_20401/m.48568 type:complete len:245 (-) Transcript_20401:201-935(-)
MVPSRLAERRGHSETRGDGLVEDGDRDGDGVPLLKHARQQEGVEPVVHPLHRQRPEPLPREEDLADGLQLRLPGGLGPVGAGARSREPIGEGLPYGERDAVKLRRGGAGLLVRLRVPARAAGVVFPEGSGWPRQGAQLQGRPLDRFDPCAAPRRALREAAHLRSRCLEQRRPRGERLPRLLARALKHPKLLAQGPQNRKSTVKSSVDVRLRPGRVKQVLDNLPLLQSGLMQFLRSFHPGKAIIA